MSNDLSSLLGSLVGSGSSSSSSDSMFGSLIDTFTVGGQQYIYVGGKAIPVPSTTPPVTTLPPTTHPVTKPPLNPVKTSAPATAVPVVTQKPVTTSPYVAQTSPATTVPATTVPTSTVFPPLSSNDTNITVPKNVTTTVQVPLSSLPNPPSSIQSIVINSNGENTLASVNNVSISMCSGTSMAFKQQQADSPPSSAKTLDCEANGPNIWANCQPLLMPLYKDTYLASVNNIGLDWTKSVYTNIVIDDGSSETCAGMTYEQQIQWHVDNELTKWEYVSNIYFIDISANRSDMKNIPSTVGNVPTSYTWCKTSDLLITTLQKIIEDAKKVAFSPPGGNGTWSYNWINIYFNNSSSCKQMYTDAFISMLSTEGQNISKNSFKNPGQQTANLTLTALFRPYCAGFCAFVPNQTALVMNAQVAYLKQGFTNQTACPSDTNVLAPSSTSVTDTYCGLSDPNPWQTITTPMGSMIATNTYTNSVFIVIDYGSQKCSGQSLADSLAATYTATSGSKTINILDISVTGNGYLKLAAQDSRYPANYTKIDSGNLDTLVTTMVNTASSLPKVNVWINFVNDANAKKLYSATFLSTLKSVLSNWMKGKADGILYFQAEPYCRQEIDGLYFPSSKTVIQVAADITTSQSNITDMYNATESCGEKNPDATVLKTAPNIQQTLVPSTNGDLSDCKDIFNCPDSSSSVGQGPSNTFPPVLSLYAPNIKVDLPCPCNTLQNIPLSVQTADTYTVTSPSIGKATVAGNSISYVPPTSGLAATDTMTYTATNSSTGSSDTGTITIDCLPAQLSLGNPTIAANCGQGFVDLLHNVTNSCLAGGNLSVTVSQPSDGSKVVLAGSVATWTGTVATSSFNYSVDNSSHTATSTGTVNVTNTVGKVVVPNISKFISCIVPATIDIFSQITNPCNEVFTLTCDQPPTGQGRVNVANGIATWSPPQTTTFTDTNFNYHIIDSSNNILSGVVDIVIQTVPLNVPATTVKTLTCPNCTTDATDLLAQLSDPCGTLSVSITSQPNKGTVVLTGSTATWLGAALNAGESVSYSYTVKSTGGSSGLGTVKINCSGQAFTAPDISVVACTPVPTTVPPTTAPTTTEPVTTPPVTTPPPTTAPTTTAPTTTEPVTTPPVTTPPPTTAPPSGDIGVFGGYIASSYSSVFITISTPANAATFGSLTPQAGAFAATSNGYTGRGIFGGGSSAGTSLNTVAYITFAVPSNSTSFGTLSLARNSLSSTSNGVSDRAVFAGGQPFNGSANYAQTIDWLTVSTGGSATSYSSLIDPLSILSSTSNGVSDRAVFAGGKLSTGTYTDTIEYLTISTGGSTVDFGNLTIPRGLLTATSNGVSDRAVFAGGYFGTGDTRTPRIDYITISTSSNATTWGNLTISTEGLGSTSNGTSDRGVLAGGDAGGSNTKTMNYLTISTTGTVSYFGDLTATMYRAAGTSNG